MKRLSENTKAYLFLSVMAIPVFIICVVIVYYIFMPLAGIDPGEFIA